MALTRKMLKAMGIEDEKIDQIIEAHSDTVDALKQERDGYKADAEKLPGVQKQLDDLKKEQEEKDGKNPWKVKYDALKEEYDGYKSGVVEKETKNAKEKALRSLLKSIGVSEKRIDAVIRVTDLDSAKLDKDGKFEGEDELTKKLKDEWADFITTEGTKTPPPENPPKNNGGKMTKEQILDIKDATERQKAIAENHEIFGF